MFDRICLETSSSSECRLPWGLRAAMRVPHKGSLCLSRWGQEDFYNSWVHEELPSVLFPRQGKSNWMCFHNHCKFNGFDVLVHFNQQSMFHCVRCLSKTWRYMYICIYIYIHSLIWTCECMHISICIYTHTSIHTYTNTYTQTYMLCVYTRKEIFIISTGSRDEVSPHWQPWESNTRPMLR